MGPAAKDAIPALDKLLRNGPADVRSSAAAALEKIKRQVPTDTVKKP
jgi:HEAT repeat protein